MQILIPAGLTPNGFGLAQNANELMIISQCCDAGLVYEQYGGEKGIGDPVEGVPRGPATQHCSACKKRYKAYSNDTLILTAMLDEDWLVRNWAGPWLGIDDLEMKIDWQT